MADDRMAKYQAIETKFRLVAESALDAIITIDEHSTIVSWNRGAEKMFGYSKEEMIEGPLHRIIPEQYRERHRHGVARLDRTGESRVIGTLSEMEGMRKDGTCFPIELTVSTWTSDNQQYYSGIIRDISERKELESQRKEQLRHRAELERHQSLSHMVVGIAHELNTPLGVIHQAATMIADTVHVDDEAPASDTPAVPAAQKSALRDLVDAANLISANAERAMNLVESFKKLSIHQMLDHKEEVDILELVSDAAQLYKLHVEGTKLDIRFYEHIHDSDRTWYGFPSYLTHIISSLLANVEHWAYPKGQGGRVDITVERVHDELGYQITVTDYGEGIADENMKHIFTPFFTTGRARGYIGLGLAIVFNLVTSALIGTIRVESRLGEGTRVRLQIPKRVVGGDVAAGMLF